MALTDELRKLEELRARGTLSETEFEQAKRRVLAGEEQSPSSGAATSIAQFRRSRSDRLIAGVMGGLARLTGWPSLVLRAAAVAIVLASPGSEAIGRWPGSRLLDGLASFVVIMYLLLWLAPLEDEERNP